MPRQAHGRPVSYAGPARPPKRKPTKSKSRGLDALEIAERQNPDTVKIPQHRLGESYESDDDDDTRADADERSSKRRKLGTEEDEEQSDGGSDPDGERWHVMDEDDEDSDIDSDDAFGESDEDRFADFTFRGSKEASGQQAKRQKRGRRHQVENEDGDEVSDEAGDIEDDFGDEGIDLAAALDHDSAAESESEEKVPSKRPKRGVSPSEDGSEASSVDEDSELVEDAEEMESDFSISDDDDGDHTKLQTFVEGLSAKKSESKSKADSRGVSASKISAADLMQYIKDPQQRQSLKVLQNSEVKGPEAYKGGIPGRLAPPLAKRQQDKLDRVAAYDQSKKELDKWVETVKQNRRAEHISFPLPDPDGAPSTNKKFAPVSTSKPMNDLESKIQDIMRESGIISGKAESAEKEMRDYEELEEQKLPPEEVQARRAELRKARDLMFREEIRAKRIKKIKSKAFRRVHRKERDKAALEERARLAAEGLLDSDEDREKNDRRRAEERMGARHRESKWAKGAKAAGRTVWDDDARVGVADMARRDDELRRRIEGRAAGSSGESDGSDSDEYSSDDAEEDIQRRLNSVDDSNPGNGTSKLANMAFMQRAEASKKAANDAQLREIRRHMSSGAGDQDSDSDAEPEDVQNGRQKFGGNSDVAPTPVAQKKSYTRSDFEERLSDEDELSEDQNQPIDTASTVVAKSVAPPKSKRSGSDNKPRATKTPDMQPKTISQSDYQRSRAVSKSTGSAPQKATPKTQQLDDQIADSDVEEQVFDAGDEAEQIQDTVFMGADDLVQDFQKEKKETVEEEGDQVVDNGLPGWGSWGGAGISKKKQKQNQGRFVTKVKGVAPESRKDAKLDRVIVNEKRVKKNGKYLATELPHPFESRQQYERSLRLPLGPEWTTKSTFQEATKPRVLVKQGVIKPMARPMV